MATTIRVQTAVLPGGRVEVASAELPVGQSVEVTITVPTPAPKMGVYDFIKSLPPGPRSAESWEEIERQFQEERNSWDR
jgi:hypothetical protein